MAGEPVKVYIYDLSRGLAAQLSVALIGKYMAGIWHTSVVVYGTEYYFGSGIQYSKPGETHLGAPQETFDAGVTHIPKDVFLDFLQDISSKYNAGTYHLLENNCNNFSAEVIAFLSGAKLPSHIAGLPQEFLSTPFGQMMRPMIDNMFANGHALTFGGTSVPASARASEGPAVATPAVAAPAVESHPHHKLSVTQRRPAQPVQLVEGRVSAICDKLRSFLATKTDARVSEFVQQLKTLETILGHPERTIMPQQAAAHLKLLCELLGPYAVLDSAFQGAENMHVVHATKQVLELEEVFPVLDLLRLLLADPSASLNTHPNLATPLTNIAYNLLARPPVKEVPRGTRATGLRVLVNALASKGGDILISNDQFTHDFTRRAVVVTACVEALLSADLMVRQTGTTLAFNLSLLLPPSDNDHSVELASALLRLLENESDSEVSYQALSTLGRLLYCNDEVGEVVQAVGLDLKPYAALSDKHKLITTDIALLLNQCA
eukprot:Colp12_sorted_trinity150504_noHs@556